MTVYCGQTNTPTTDETPLPCDDFRSTRCTVHEETIAYLSLAANTPLDVVLDTYLLSLIDARNRLAILEAKPADVITNITDTSYTVLLSDSENLVVLNNASPVTVTIPLNSVTAFPVGTEIDLVNRGSGIVTISPSAGVFLLEDVGGLSINSGGARTIKKIDTDLWVVKY